MLHCFLPGSWVPPLQTPSAMPEVQSSGELAMMTWQRAPFVSAAHLCLLLHSPAFARSKLLHCTHTKHGADQPLHTACCPLDAAFHACTALPHQLA